MLLVGLSRHAVAGDAGRAHDPARAEQLFAKGMAELKQGHAEAACAAFAASQAAEPSVGALLNLARCHESAGKTATAWAEYRDAARLAEERRDESRRKGAAQLADGLEPRLSKLILEVASPPPGLVVSLDGLVLPASERGTALLVDPGLHRVEARAEGRSTWRQEITVAPGPARRTVVVPPLEPDVPKPASRGHLVTGLAMLAVGGAAMAAGAVQSVRALRMDGKLEGRCGPLTDGVRACDTAAVADLDDLRFTGNMATVLLAAGGGVAAAGLVVTLTAPGASPSGADAVRVTLAPRLAPTAASLVLSGAF